ncbi:MAG: carboxypeptidase-like regulatory domain-containing protein, partial [Candidatus Acidiferrum sp.]
MNSSSSSFFCSIFTAKGSWLSRGVFVLLLLLGLPFFAAAQEATIVGTVTDPSGSVVPNVTVTITNTKTGAVRTMTTNDVG